MTREAWREREAARLARRQARLREAFGEPEPRFNQASPEYVGALIERGGWRLSVSFNGTRYLLQQRRGDLFGVVRWRKRLSDLGPFLPEAISAAPELAALPDSPELVDRPWRDQIERGRERYNALDPASDGFAGVVGGSDTWRLAVIDGEFVLQLRWDARWRKRRAYATGAEARRELFSAELPETGDNFLVVSERCGWVKRGPFRVVRSDALREALLALPDGPPEAQGAATVAQSA